MPGRPVLPCTFVLVLTIAGLGPAFDAAAQTAAHTAPALPQAAGAPGPAADDMAMPDDMGAPIASGAPAAASPPAGPASAAATRPVQRLSVDTPINVIAATPQGKAALERELPGLCERPEYVIFRTMSPAKLALLSNGRISQAKLTQLQAHLVRVSVGTTAEPPRRNVLAEGATRVKRFSQSAYHRVVSAIQAL